MIGKFVFSALILIILVPFVRADIQSETDSIVSLLKHTKNEERLDLLLLLGNKLVNVDPVAAQKYAEEASDLGQSLDSKLQLAKAWILMGNVSEVVGEYDEAIRYSNKALKAFKKLDFQNGEGEAYNSIGRIYFMQGNYTEALKYFRRSFAIYSRLEDDRKIGNLSNNIGSIYYQWAEFDKALEYYNKALEIDRKLDDDDGMAGSYSNIGLVMERKGDYSKASEFFYKALEINERLGDNYRVSICYNNLGILYETQKMTDKAVECYNKSLAIRERMGDKYGVAACLSNISGIFASMKMYAAALEYAEKSLAISIEMNNVNGMQIAYNSIGYIYLDIKDYPLAMKNFQLCFDICDQNDLRKDKISALYNMGQIFALEGNNTKALEYQQKALDLANEIDSKEDIKNVYSVFSETYFGMGRYKEAYISLSSSVAIQEELMIDNNAEMIIELQTRYETDKKEKEIALLNKDLVIRDTKLANQKVITYAVIAVLVLVILAILLVYYQFLVKKKANKALLERNIEIEQQKEEIASQRDQIETQHNLVIEQRDTILIQKEEITDSIQYAKRIQRALFPPDSYISNALKEYFIMFRPRDIVSGDFYWLHQINDRTIIAVADCTGHGVPGAFMSMLGISLLNEMVNKLPKEFAASDILCELRENLIASLHQTGEISSTSKNTSDNVKDGMDISLCVFDNSNSESGSLEIQFAGANNPLYIVRSLVGESEAKPIVKFEEVKGDRMPIGIYHQADEKPFNNHVIKLSDGDCLYLFSDGFADQMGGEQGRKFKAGPFRDLIHNIGHLPFSKQKQRLETVFDEWKGQSEQVDDVVVMGIKL